MEGKFHENEDRYIIKESLIGEYQATTSHNQERANDFLFSFFTSCSLFAAIDGHGGSSCAEFIRKNLIRLFLNSTPIQTHAKPIPNMLSDALEEVVENLEKEFSEVAARENDNAGACLVVALIYKDWICVANVGDCLAVCWDHDKKIKLLSRLHRAVLTEERERIEAAGGCVIKGRAMGQTIPSRSIGDLDTKNGCIGAVIAKPYISTLQVKGNSKSLPLLLLATDGLWDAVDAKRALKETRKQVKMIQKQKSSVVNIDPLLYLCSMAQLETKDDITAILVKPSILPMVT